MAKFAIIVIAGLFPATASASDYNLPMKKELTKYSSLYHAVKKDQGKRAPGRNIRRWGIKTSQGIRAASAREIARSINALRNLRNPYLTSGPPSIPPAGVQTPHAGGTLSRIAACESGGNPRAVNPNGHYGKYQFDLQTWASVGGSGNPVNASESEQDMRAARLYAQRGGAPWACKA